MKMFKKILGIFSLGSIVMLLLSGFFPGYLSSIDSIRIQGQQTFFSSISAVRYPNTNDMDNIDHDTIFQYLEEKLLPGDIIFTYREGFVTNELIDGKRKHSSIYVGKRENLVEIIKKYNIQGDILNQYNITQDNNDMLIIDSTEDGVGIRSLNHLTYLNDILIARINTSPQKNETMLYNILQDLGKEYNYDFDINDTSRIYCAQLIYEGLASIDIAIPYTLFAGRSFLYPQNIVDYIFDEGIKKKEFTIITAIKNIQTEVKFFSYDDIIMMRNLKSHD